MNKKKIIGFSAAGVLAVLIAAMPAYAAFELTPPYQEPAWTKTTGSTTPTDEQAKEMNTNNEKQGGSLLVDESGNAPVKDVDPDNPYENPAAPPPPPYVPEQQLPEETWNISNGYVDIPTTDPSTDSLPIEVSPMVEEPVIIDSVE